MLQTVKNDAEDERGLKFAGLASEEVDGVRKILCARVLVIVVHRKISCPRFRLSALILSFTGAFLSLNEGEVLVMVSRQVIETTAGAV